MRLKRWRAYGGGVGSDAMAYGGQGGGIGCGGSRDRNASVHTHASGCGCGGCVAGSVRWWTLRTLAPACLCGRERAVVEVENASASAFAWQGAGGGGPPLVVCGGSVAGMADGCGLLRWALVWCGLSVCPRRGVRGVSRVARARAGGGQNARPSTVAWQGAGSRGTRERWRMVAQPRTTVACGRGAPCVAGRG